MNDEDQQEQPATLAPTTPGTAHPATGTLSVERLAAKALETRLLGGERKVSSGPSVSTERRFGWADMGLGLAGSATRFDYIKCCHRYPQELKIRD